MRTKSKEDFRRESLEVWDDFTLYEKDGTGKVICNHCGMKFAKKVGRPNIKPN